jgi:tRNA (guanine37-N1)-methyltransferase
MRIDVVTLFPELVDHAARFGVTGRALQRGLWRLGVWNPRDFATDNHRTVDDRPYGGVRDGDARAAAGAGARGGAAAQRAEGLSRRGRSTCRRPACRCRMSG